MCSFPKATRHGIDLDVWRVTVDSIQKAGKRNG